MSQEPKKSQESLFNIYFLKSGQLEAEIYFIYMVENRLTLQEVWSLIPQKQK